MDNLTDKNKVNESVETSVSGRLSATQIKAIDLLVMKDINGLSNDDIADSCNVDRSTLYRWKQKKAFNDELIKRADEFNKSFLPDVYSSLRGILATGKTYEKLKAIELMLKGQGKLKEAEVNNTINNNTADVSNILDRLGIK